MTQSRLNALGMLAIEAEEAKKMSVKDLIQAFANFKARRKDFL